MQRRAIVAIFAGLALAATGCTPSLRWVAPTSGNGSSTAPSPGSSTTAAVNWKPCDDVARQMLPRLASGVSYDCGSVLVPQDWNNRANGKTFEVALMRVRSQHQYQRIGSLITNPGGPGASGVQLAAYLSLELPDEILQRFDIVGFDPRGVGNSTPAVKCFSDADLDSSFSTDPDPQTQAQFDSLAGLWRRMDDGCQQKYGDTLSLFSTEQAARDIDAIRAGVGDQKISYLGFSYGTLLGATYAQLFPKNIRAFVLDGAVDPTQKAIDAAEGQAKGFENAFNQFASWCRQNSCAIAPDARAAANSVLAKARSNPVSGTDGRKATAGWVLTGVIEALYSQSEWPALASAVAALNQGNATGILQLADSYANRDSSGHYDNMFDIFNTVSCDDDNSGETVAQARNLQLQWRAKYPLFGAALATGLLGCALWPAKRDPFPTGQAAGAPPIVVVGTINDPATPYVQTGRLANMLGNATVVTWQGQGHTAYPQTSCIRSTIDAYLINLTVPAANTTCPAR
ncbi:MAG TPA: alpha/beta hydrolase [Rugosimonospora sp.]|nr:alpha/beta hydrolase [Rugosimonospora sp.]